QDPLEKRFQIPVDVGLAGFDRDAPVHDRPKRNLIDKASTDTGNGDGSTVTAGEDGLAERVRAIGLEHQGLFDSIVCADDSGRVRLHADGLDTSVGTVAAS